MCVRLACKINKLRQTAVTVVHEQSLGNLSALAQDRDNFVDITYRGITPPVRHSHSNYTGQLCKHCTPDICKSVTTHWCLDVQTQQAAPACMAEPMPPHGVGP